MTQIYNENGEVSAVTAVKVLPCLITRIKNVDSDGYEAVQISCGSRKSHFTKPLAGQLKNYLSFFNNKAPKYIKEFRCAVGDFKAGDILKADIFTPGEKVVVRGFTKGRGFSGVVKRHGFAGHPASHGHKDQERMPGSIGSKRGKGGGVQKGKKMAGRYGNEQVCLKNLTIIKVDDKEGIVYLKGALPGARRGYLEIVHPTSKIEKKLENFLDQRI